MKKIIFTVTNDLTYDQRMQRICRSLCSAGYEVELVGRHRDFSVAIQPEPYRQTRLECFFNKGKLFYFEYNLRLLFYLTFSRFDAACAVDLDTIVPVYIIGKLKGAKLIYDAHEYFTEVPEVVRRPMVKKVWEWVEKSFAPRFDLIYTVSPGLAELFQKKFDKKVEVIMNLPLLQAKSGEPVLLHRSPYGPSRESEPARMTGSDGGAVRQEIDSKQQDTYLLYQGALNEGRGLEQLINAMQTIDCKLKLAGEGDLSAELRQLVQRLQLGSKVEFLGYLRPDELRKATAGALIGMQLLENKGLSYYYSLSNKFFDYIQAGVPQVCIDFPEYRNINNQHEVAVLIKDCSPEQIRTAILSLLSDQNLYAKLQINCDVCSRLLNWQNEEKKLLSLYGYLLR